MVEDDSSIILAYIPLKKIISSLEYEENPDDEDEEWFPDEKEVKKETVKKNKPLVLNFKNPRPVHNLSDLIGVLEDHRNDIESRKLKKRKKKKDLEGKRPTKKQKTSNRATPVSKILKKKINKTSLSQIDELIGSLKELQNLIGMEYIKQNIVNQLLLFIQGLNDKGMFLHTVLTGDPGCGKTSLCNILAKIYKSMGFLEKSEVIVADRPSLIGQWLGETSIKTKKVLDSAKGSILLIDEAYSLGNEEGRDSFSKECIDTLNQYLSEHVDELVCIIAGYKDNLDKCFFNYNQGLSRRFAWRYHIDNYTTENIYDILLKQIGISGWTLGVEKQYIINIINGNKKLFKNNGGDTKNFFEKCKICHAQRIFGSKSIKKNINHKDVDNALKLFINTHNQHNTIDEPPIGLYC